MQNYKFIRKKTPVRKTTKQSLAGLSVQFNVSGETISFCHKCLLVKNIASLNTAGIRSRDTQVSAFFREDKLYRYFC